MILSLAGEEPESVMATGGNYLHQKIADVTTTHLAFPSGLKAHVFVSWLHPFKEQKLVVVGDRKMAVFNDTNPWADKLVLYPHEIKWAGGIPVAAKAEPEREVLLETEPLRSECQHFLESIVTGQVPQTDGHEGVRVLKVLNESQRSLDEYTRNTEGRNPVSPTPESANDSFFVHSKAVIDEDVNIGDGTKIWHFSHILAGSHIGENCNIGQNVVIGPEVSIGNRCKIQNNVSIYKGVTLEDEVFCGPSMVFTNVYNPRAAIRRMSEVKPTLVKKGATIGANATIVCDIVIGEHGFVGAGSVVTRNVKDYALVVGNPAQQVGWMCECGVRLDDKLACEACGKEYEYKEDESDGIRLLL
jgi:UDP-2-acetamido-3-amino-2,3-dideoxy-glucuronate N-acetyltransferase